MENIDMPNMSKAEKKVSYRFSVIMR